MYAIIQTGGKQYKVKKGEKVTVDKLIGELGAEINFDQVLLIADDNNTNVGSPTVAGASVKAIISKQFRGEKIIVFKKKRRHNYRRKNGHRQYFTEIEIQDIKTA